MKNVFALSVSMAAALLLSASGLAAEEKLILNDGTVMSIVDYTFDGEDYQVETKTAGQQVYHKTLVRCISYTCGTIASIAADTDNVSQKPSPDAAKPQVAQVAEQKAQPAPIVKKSIDPAFFAIHGSNTIGAKLMPALLENHANVDQWKVNKQVGDQAEESLFVFADPSKGKKSFSVEFQAHGSSTSFKGLKSGDAMIGMSSRSIKDKEHQALKEVGLGDLKAYGSEHVLALDGLTVIVHPQNTVSALSMADLAKVFSGEITDWSELGGKAGKINIYARDDQSGTYDTFKSLVLKPAKVKLSADAKRFESNQKLSDLVSEDLNGIGFTGMAYLRKAKALALLGSCDMRFEPSDFTVKTEEYPLARRLYLYTSGEPANAHAKAILDSALSDQAQAVITDVGFINQDIDLKKGDNGKRLSAAIKMPIEDQQKFKELSMQMDKSIRASITFRFKIGSYELDNKAKMDIGRLARYLKLPENANKRFMLLGFADSRGAFANNLMLSKRRAEVVAAALKQEGVEPSLVEGYSELAPVACNEGAGLEKNRRVEVWILK